MIKLTIKQILDFYDVPQLFTASDTLGTNYLCVLYSQNDGFEYLGVQLSELRLNTFMTGELDLRKIYLQPEQDNSLYHIVVSNQNAVADKLLQQGELTEQMLPAPGYYYDVEDAISNSNMDSLQIDIPIKDRGFLADIANRMGWITKTINESVRRIAVL